MIDETFLRVNNIWKHTFYRENLYLNEKAEEEREFCRHNMAHFLDVARIAQILNLKEEQNVEEELIYASALLHDIGRYVQYKDGTPHEKASAVLALPILKDCGFYEDEIAVILSAIKNHRKEAAAEIPGLDGLLYRGDKRSRSCFACKVEETCKWNANKKNMDIAW